MAGFSETNGVVYAKFHKSIIHITVLYELIKGITVLYMPNQVHNCTVWLIQYSHAVDYYFMIYTAHFFALILPRKVQYVQLTVVKYNIPFKALPMLVSHSTGSAVCPVKPCIIMQYTVWDTGYCPFEHCILHILYPVLRITL